MTRVPTETPTAIPMVSARWFECAGFGAAGGSGGPGFRMNATFGRDQIGIWLIHVSYAKVHY